ncbi:nickel-dependent lactate racemase [Desulfofundulus thermobenzoicus]|uniref:Nickel-dependent lactate racemase n=1 Tax=Desulfofundulus thermobenzoicus TaxID=29376 RepID=A0A6N7IR06_9FIRM|nr:nickel-dependent lactate racemase [Desulfofundulus thermobenzoicus]MQL52484.1 nickel-dependent lactate racemase [Desulfofundulus thermobenzoicus]HHW43548.1 nickel-dependent lactate racemase [Desulfotomaculum sp.]
MIKLPYDTGYLELPLDPGGRVHVLTAPSSGYRPEGRPEELVRQSLQNPVSSPPLSAMVAGKSHIVIISSDHTRPVPSRITVPLLLEEIKKGNPRAKITILVATGMHRPSTPEELTQKFGEEVLEQVTVKVHRSQEDEEMTFLGNLPSGGELWVNKLAVEADLLVAEGFIEPHFFAGFSGGRKSVLPGIASHKTVLYNHNARFIASPYARTGIMENNPIHEDMLWAAERAGLSFILNVVINSQKKIIHSVAGHPVEAHRQGCAFVHGQTAVKARPADIVISTNGGYPLDQNLYQSVKGMTAAEASAAPEAVIIMVSRCRDGLGGDHFFHLLADYPSPQAAMDRFLATAAGDTVPDQWQAQILARILLKHRVIVVTDPALAGTVRQMHMDYAPTLEEALQRARSMKGRDASITVIPDGIGVIVEQDGGKV